MEHNLLITALIVYIIGSIPFAFILNKIFGKGDIRNIGSGNVGATNVLRTGKKTLALIVLIFDILKGYLPTFYIMNFLQYSNYNLIAYLLGSMAIVGHLFPIWLKFKGGKGVATYIGFIFAINYIIGFIFVFIWISIFLLKKYSSLASITSLIIIPIIILFFGVDTRIFLFFLIISIIIISKHFPNIKRLLNDNESKIKL